MLNTKSEFGFILQQLRELGFRITKQKKIIIGEILGNLDASTKELCYLVKEKDASIGQSSVYRTVQQLEMFGFIQRRKMIVLTGRDVPYEIAASH